MHCSITGRRNQRKQPKTWIEYKTRHDMRNIGLQFDEAMAMVQDKSQMETSNIAASSSYWWKRKKEEIIWISGVFRIRQRGGHGEHKKCEPITGVWGWRPQRGPGAEPLIGGPGGLYPPWSWNTFCFWVFNESRKFAHFSLKFGNAENHRVISGAILHDDFNRMLYQYEKKPSNIV